MEWRPSVHLCSSCCCVVQAVLMVAGANATTDYEADRDTIQQVLECFLVATDCDLFKSVLTLNQANKLGMFIQTVYIVPSALYII